MTAGRHRVDISFHPFAPEPASFRFAVSKEQGDIDAAAAAAADASVAVVFANDNGVLPAGDQEHTDPSHTVGTLPRDEVRLIRAVAAANPRTVVVLNTGGPVVTRPWIDDPGVAAVLQMWNAGSEGGTATARLLLGLAAPSGRSPITWPREGTDTIWAYDQPEGLYPGDTAGTHPERLNGLDAPEAHCSRPPGATHPCTRTVMTQGIYSGYRFYDQMGLAPQFPFGYGLSYTEFDYSDLSTRWDGDRLVVGLTVANTGEHRGTAVPQVYVGPVTPEPPGAQQALRSLAGFERVTLDPGATRRIEVVVPARSFQYWNEEDQAWVTPSGRRAILAGEPDDASRLPLSADVEID